MSHAFISYKHDDPSVPDNFITEMFDHLRDAAIPFWQDKNDLRAGDEWFTQIDSALENSFAIVVVLTRLASESSFITYEWTRVLGFGIRPLTLWVDNDLKHVHPKLTSFENISFRGGKRPWGQLIRELKVRQKEYENRVKTPLATQLFENWRDRILNAPTNRDFSAAELIEVANKMGVLSAQDKYELLQLLANKGFY